MDHIANIVVRADENHGCTKSTCPPSESIYGYAPNLGATIFFLILFSLSAIAYVVQGIKSRTYIFTAAMVLGSTSELLGYVAKMLLNNDPFSDLGFKMSVALLTFAPAFYSAGIYYSLKHICITFGSNLSRIQPKLYTWIFISCDWLSIILQATGGALSAASSSLSVLNIATNILIAGLAFQVFTMLVFGVLASDYAWTVYRNSHQLNPATKSLRSTLRFRLFVLALWIAYFGILLRCVYRVAELVGGWTDNPILRNEGLFIGLDSVPCGIAALVLNVWHPGWCFPKKTQELVVDEEKENVQANDNSRGEGE